MNSTGCKDDCNKLEWLLLPYNALEEIVKVLMFGKTRYGADNWKQVPNAKERYLNAAMRHLTSYASGQPTDSESGLSHLAHAACSLLFVIWFDLGNKPTYLPTDESLDALKRGLSNLL